jgi:hypothetical protein
MDVSKVTDLLSKLDERLGVVRSLYYVESVAKFFVGRGKAAIDCLASNIVTQLLQSQFFSLKLAMLVCGGGTKAATRLWAFLVGRSDKAPERHSAWLSQEFATGGIDNNRLRIVLDCLYSRAAPTAVQLSAMYALSILGMPMLTLEAGKRIGKAHGKAYAALIMAGNAFCEATTEQGQDTKPKRASVGVSLQSIQAQGKAQAAKRKAAKAKPKRKAPPNVSSD